MRETPLLLTIEQTAELLNLSRTSIYRLINDGRLPIVKIGRSVRIRRSTVEEIVGTWESR